MMRRPDLFRWMITFVLCTFLFNPAAAASLALLSHTAIPATAVDNDPATTSWLQKNPIIRVGLWDPAHPPFRVDIDPHNFEGVTADYLALIGRMLRVSFIIMPYPDKATAVRALQSGEVDMLPGTESMRDLLPGQLTSDTYLADHSVLVSQLPLLERERLQGKLLIYPGNHDLRETLHKAYPGARLIAREDYYASMAAVANDGDVVMWSNDVTADEINRRIYANRLVLTPGSVLPQQGQNFIAGPRAGPLMNAINTALNVITTQAHSQIAETWRLTPTVAEENSPLALTQEEREWVAAHPIVPVMVVNTHIPLTFINAEGEESGYTISLLKKIGLQSGLHFTWQPFNNVVEMREQLKKAPVSLIAAADASAGQAPDIAFSRPYQISNWVLVTRKSFPTLTSLADMAGKKVAVFTGSYFLPALREEFPQVEFVEEDFSLETALSILINRLDGVIVPQTAANFVLQSYLEDRFRIAISVPLPPLRLAMATSSNNRPLLSIIDKALRTIPPRAMDAQLTGWQMRYALERFEVWGRYRTAILTASAVLVAIALMLVFYFWRNRFLKRNLETQRRLQDELQAAKLQVEKASESKSLFLSQMSHEIRTPMNALIGLLELENRGKSSPQQQRNNLAVAWESAKSLLMLVGDILDMAKIESGKFTVRQIPVSLSETMNSVSTLFRYSAEEKGLKLHTSVEVRDDRILFDPVMLKQIASNLVSNAIKFTSQGEVEIVIYQKKAATQGMGDFVLEVCDTGVGLTPALQSAIFEPFVQVEASQESYRGTGLGLSICRQLAELLGGTLEVESIPHEGSNFIFSFSAPLNDGTDAQQEKHIVPVSVTSMKILVVDDHPPNRLLLTQQLAFVGHRSVSAENGAQALRLWQSEQPPFDLVITDCNMPEMSGFELVRQLREQEVVAGWPPRPMFGLTAMAEREVLERAAQAGMTDCLFKPVELAKLLALINNLGPEGQRQPAVDTHIILSLEKLARSQPARFTELIHAVMIKNQQDMTALQRDIVEGDFVQIKHRAHSLLGGARLIEATALADASKKMETAAADEDLPQIKILAESCEALVIQLERELEQVLSDKETDARSG